MSVPINGTEINYFRSGKDEGVPVFMSHSLGSSSLMWNPQLDVLNAAYPVIRMDTRGHGGSAAPAGAYDLDMLGDDAIELMNHLQLDRVHWVGLSMGGMIGQNLALRYPERLKSLALCDTSAQIPAEARQSWDDRINTVRMNGMSVLADTTMQRWFTDNYLLLATDDLRMIRTQFEMTKTDGFIGCCEAIRNLDYLDQLNRIELPTLVIVGEEDEGTPVAASQAICEKISSASLVVLPAARHLSNVEQAGLFNAALMPFLSAHS